MVLVSTGRNAGRGKVVYSWISPDPAKAGPALGGGGGVVTHGLSSVTHKIGRVFLSIYYLADDTLITKGSNGAFWVVSSSIGGFPSLCSDSNT